jgi:hypothetical protein
MITIFKYQLRITDLQKIESFEGAKPICVMNQGGVLTMWAEVNTSLPKSTMEIEVHGTGNPQDSTVSAKYVGSAIVEPFVWHVYARC